MLKKKKKTLLQYSKEQPNKNKIKKQFATEASFYKITTHTEL